MGVIAKGILRGCQGLFTPVSLGYPLSVFNKKLYSHVRVTPAVDPPTFCLVTIFSVESKEMELELEQPRKKIAIPVFIKELGECIKKKFNKYVNIKN